MHNIKSTSEINYCHEKANEMFSQLFWSIDKWTYGSWGVSKRMYTFFIVPMIKNPAPVRSKCCRDGAQRFPDQKPVFGKISCKKKQART